MKREDIERMAKEAGFKHFDKFPDDYQDKLQRFAKLVADFEREKCAQVLDESARFSFTSHLKNICQELAEMIRKRED